MKNRICIGKIVSAHGVKGLVKILPFCEDLDLLEGSLYTAETGDETLDISLKNPVGKYLLAQVEGITDRSAAENLKCSLFIPREALPEARDGEYYVEDLIGLRAMTSEGASVGTVIAAPDFGAGVLLEIRPPAGDTFYIPFQSPHAGDVDLEARTVIVHDIQDFLP